jgi:hypothetical protein
MILPKVLTELSATKEIIEILQKEILGLAGGTDRGA